MNRYSNQVNPAAVLGYALPSIYTDRAPSTDFNFHARKLTLSSGTMFVELFTKDTCLLQLLDSSDILDPKYLSDLDLDGKRFIRGRLEYDKLTVLMGAMHESGYNFERELANRQADAAAKGASLAILAAYETFQSEAVAFLQKVQALNLVALASPKGIRQVQHPFRATAIVNGSASVLVSPDPHDERFVDITVRSGLFDPAVLQIRELAYDHYEKLGMRVQFHAS